MFSKFHQLINSILPQRKTWWQNVFDPRKQHLIKYQLRTLIWYVVFTFQFKTSATRSLYFFLKGADADDITLYNFKTVAEDFNIKKIPHYDTVKWVMGLLEPKEIEDSGIKLSKHLLRRKSLDKLRFKDSYVFLAIDGTQQLYFKKRHCPNCLKTKLTKKDKNGKHFTTYYYHHNLLTARFVFSNGITLFAGQEFIENTQTFYDKQDCELKAAYRLIKRVKENFPKLPICFLGDGLYLNKKITTTCTDFNWKYFITFKQGSAPALFQDYECQKRFNLQNTLKIKTEYGIKNKKQLNQHYYWQNGIEFGSNKLNIIECLENDFDKTTRFVYATNFLADRENVSKLINGGRQRSKIENEVFNEEKNGGYNLEHLYCEELKAIKNYTILLSIAHMLNHLFEKGVHTKKDIQCNGGIKYLTEKLRNSFKYLRLDIKSPKVYLCFDTS